MITYEMNILWLTSTADCSVCTTTDWDSCKHNSQRTSHIRSRNRLHILWVTGYIHVHASVNADDQMPHQKSLSGSLVSLFSRSLLFDNAASRALRSSCHSPTYSRVSLMLSLTCSISAAISRSVFSRKLMNSTSFFDAEIDRRELARGEAQGGGEPGRSLWGGSEGEQVMVIPGTEYEVRDARDSLEEEEAGKGSAERGGAAVEPLALRREPACSDSEKSRGEVGMSSSMKSGFSEGPIIDSRFWDAEVRGLRIRVIRCCRRGRANLQNLVPIPRSTRDATSSRIKVPAPSVVIIA